MLLTAVDEDADEPHDHTVIQGNRYDDVADQQACCDLCTNHPLCTGWEYDDLGVCMLKEGELHFVANPAEAELTIWAGRPSGVACAV